MNGGGYWARVFEHSGWANYGPFPTYKEANETVLRFVSAKPPWADRGHVTIGRYGPPAPSPSEESGE